MAVEVGNAFFGDLQAEAFAHTHEVLGDVAGAAQRLWTSAKVMKCVPSVCPFVCLSVCLSVRVCLSKRL